MRIKPYSINTHIHTTHATPTTHEHIIRSNEAKKKLYIFFLNRYLII